MSPELRKAGDEKADVKGGCVCVIRIVRVIHPPRPRLHQRFERASLEEGLSKELTETSLAKAVQQPLHVDPGRIDDARETPTVNREKHASAEMRTGTWS
jgi:hypothetical protein